MKRFLSLLAVGSLLVTYQVSSADDELMLAVNTNFKPARPATAEEVNKDAAAKPTPPPAPQATPVPTAPPAPVIEPGPPPAPVTDVEREDLLKAAREEIIRRQESQLAARKIIQDADRLYANGDYDAAAEKYEAALAALPEAKATSEDRADALDGINRTYYRLAEAALAEDNYSKAIQYANRALETDPDSRAAARMLVKAQRAQGLAQHREANPPPPDPSKTEEFLDARERIRELFREAKIMLNSGQYDLAETTLQQILIIDPYNTDAVTLLNEVNTKRLQFAMYNTNKARERRLWEVERAWVPPLGRDVRKPDQNGKGTVIEAETRRQAEMTKKLGTIVFPEINFRDAVITDVVNFLSDESRKLDPSGVGVSIVLLLGEDGSAAPAPAPAAPADDMFIDEAGMGMGRGAPAPMAPESTGAPRISVTLREIPMIDALRLITQAAGLKFRIEPHAVVVLPKNVTVEELLTKSYPIAPGVIRDVLSTPEDGGNDITGDEEFRGMGESGMSAAPQDVKQFFADAGIPFPEGSSLIYNERASKIIIRNTADNLEIFEQILRDINETPLQVEIETKFIDISQADLDELGFEWKIGQRIFGDFDTSGGTPNEAWPPGSGVENPNATDLVTGGLRDSTLVQGNAIDSLLGLGGGGVINEVANIRGVLTNPQFEVVIKALSQKGSTDLLSAPKITTISGNSAQIRIVQEFIYPTEFEPPQVGDQVITPAIPAGFKTREVGVLLNVTPTVGPDQYTINLTLIPEVSEFLGFIDYSPPPTRNITRVEGSDEAIITESANLIQQPLFFSRNLTTTVVIWDGQTVVLGGLISESISKVHDKVPFLGDIPFFGRLFQSKVEVRSKRNLLIFVSAVLVDPAGNPINTPETLQAVAVSTPSAPPEMP